MRGEITLSRYNDIISLLSQTGARQEVGNIPVTEVNKMVSTYSGNHLKVNYMKTSPEVYISIPTTYVLIFIFVIRIDM